METSTYPVVVIGAGPVGLAAAAHLAERGMDFLVLEAGDAAGWAMRQWGHITLFSPWRYNVDAAARRLLETAGDGCCAGDAGAQGWVGPRETQLPTGAQMVSEYLEPLAAHPAVAPHVRYGHRVEAVTRVRGDGAGVDKGMTRGRDGALFLVRVATAGGSCDVVGRAVIDASGTWGHPNPLGRAGVPAVGEAEVGARVTSPLPDPLGADAERFAGSTVLVVGAGHSAANTLISLGRLAARRPGTRIVWGLRGALDPARLYGGGAADELPARGQLGVSVKRLVDSGVVTVRENLAIARLDSGERVTVTQASGERFDVDWIVPATGFRPDLRMLGELRLDIDAAVEAPRELGPLIDPEFHSCGTVKAHGEAVLAHPERGFYIVGMKSYGRAPTFLMATGYEQVRSVVAALAGDRAAADRVELELPQTGICVAGVDGAGAGRDSVLFSQSTPVITQQLPGERCC